MLQVSRSNDGNLTHPCEIIYFKGDKDHTTDTNSVYP